MRIPSSHRGEWAAELVKDCTASRQERVQRGSTYRNIFLTGSPEGVPQTYLRTQDFIRDLLAMIYSASDLRFAVSHFGQVSPVERAKAKAAAAALTQHIVNNDIDDAISDIILWSLIKGKTIQKLVWSRNCVESYLIQPECFGVYNESISGLDRQEAFVHTTFETRSRFRQIISGLPADKQVRLMKSISTSQTTAKAQEDNGSAALKQIIVGGLYPYQVAGSSPATSQASGTVTHLFAPAPVLRSETVQSLIPMNELWVWNDEQDDWATITLIGDEIVFGEHQLYNAFAHDVLTNPRIDQPNNPLKGHHPFIEYCAMPLDGYFWGISYVFLVSLLQHSINNRIDGINVMLRKQEDPPRYITGSTAINQNAYAKLNKAGGYFTDGSPNAKIQDIVKDVPADIWRSFHELNNMFDTIGGFPPILQGESQGAVRSQGQADTLLRTGAARHLDAALKIERSIERCGSTIFDLLRAKEVKPITAWIMPGTQSQQIDPADEAMGLEPPAKGMKPIVFQFHDVSQDAKVTVDSHSASPAFRHEQRELAFALAKAGAVNPKRLVEMTHPPMEDEIIEDLEQKEIQTAELIAKHPELLEAQLGHKHKK